MKERGGRGEGERSFGVRRTMVATNQRDYATISRMDMAGSHDKSSCRSVTINNNIWTDGCCDSPSLNSVIRARARLFRTLRTLLHARFISRDNKSRRRATDQRARARARAGFIRENAISKRGRDPLAMIDSSPIFSLPKFRSRTLSRERRVGTCARARARIFNG